MPSFFCLLLGLAFALITASGCFRRATNTGETPSDVELVADDGVHLTSTLYPSARAMGPAIIFLPMAGSDRAAWRPIAVRAQRDGFMGLALDLRGFGGSAHNGAGVLDYRSFSDSDWRGALRDVAASKKLLVARGADPNNIAVAGAGIGASVALRYSVDDPGIAAAILISPGLLDHGYHADEDIVAYGHRPVLLMCGDDDLAASTACATLKQRAPGFCELRSYPGAARGTDLLAASPNAMEQFAQWITPILKSSKPPVTVAP